MTDYRVYMRVGDIELGADGVDPDQALRLFNRLRGDPPSRGGSAVEQLEMTIELSKEMLEAGAAVIKRCRVDPTYVRGMSDQDIARAVFDAAVQAAGRVSANQEH